MNIVLVGDRILIEPHKAEEKTPGGIVVPENAKAETRRGTVREVGPGRVYDSGFRVDMTARVGDTVLYQNYHNGSEFDLNGAKHIVLSELEILAILR